MRDLIDLVEAANRLPLPKPEIVFSDEEVRLTLEQGFDCGVRFGASVHQRDLEAVERLFEDAEEDGTFNPQRHDRHAWLAKWLRGPRYRFVASEIRANLKMESGALVVEREIIVSRKLAMGIAAGKVPHLGEFWSFSGGQHGWGHDAPKTALSVFLVALVDPAAVDWVTTIRRNANYMLGDEEDEVSLTKGTPVRLLRLYVDRTEVPVQEPNQKA